MASRGAACLAEWAAMKHQSGSYYFETALGGGVGQVGLLSMEDQTRHSHFDSGTTAFISTLDE
jgi:hypothetical protein